MREGRLPNGEPFPDIVLHFQVGMGLGANMRSCGSEQLGGW